MAQEVMHQVWKKDGYFISMDPSLVPIPEVTAAFASPEMYWCKPLPAEVMLQTLHNSLCFGVYKLPNTDISSPIFVGLARLVTDEVTFAYLTDVYVDPKYQGEGLGTWLVSCVQEVIEAMPYLRRTILLTGGWKRSVPFYKKILGMEVMETKAAEGLAIMEAKGPGHPHFT
ncbi:hypothetical protein VTL71DRAFT_12237 [Oculimacula yallundae]|uniref:N-acetyltransferase domain-containing protein n=1 Tax=Oculimacula yallundae TaxID=86028 RepID=A0ABR4CSC8_9HELO